MNPNTPQENPLPNPVPETPTSPTPPQAAPEYQTPQPASPPVLGEPGAFVSDTHQVTRKKVKPLLIAGVLALVLIAGIVGVVLLIREPQTTATTPKETVTDKADNSTDSNNNSVSDTTDNKSENPTNSTPASLIAERDTERKNELKNLQMKLEMYFNYNGEYPAALSAITSDNDELTDPSGVAYTYTPAADLQTYTLSIALENKDDSRADTNGNYVIISVN